MNSALADSRRRAGKLAAIIVRNSILVTYSSRHTNLSSTQHEPHSTRRQPQPAHLDPRPHHATAATTVSSISSLVTHSSPALHNPHARKTNGIVQTPPTTFPAHTTHHAHRLSNAHSSTDTRTPASVSRDKASVRTGVETHDVTSPLGAGANGTRVSGSAGKEKASASAKGGSASRPKTKTSANAESQRRHFLRKLGCVPEDPGCESEGRQPPRTASRGPFPSLAGGGAGGTTLQGVPSINTTPSAGRQDEYGDRKETEALPTEFSEAEKDFEPLYLREDDERDHLTDAAATTPPAPTRKPRPTPRLTEEQLRALPPCPEIPPDLSKCSFSLTFSF